MLAKLWKSTEGHFYFVLHDVIVSMPRSRAPSLLCGWLASADCASRPLNLVAESMKCGEPLLSFAHPGRLGESLTLS